MIATTLRNLLAALAVIAGFTSIATAGELTKEECLDAHSRGQDAKEQGKLSLARKLFLTCAQPSCPSLVQNDCARFTDELSRVQPSVSFVARDAAGSDLPDTTVYVDEALVATRLDDGTLHDIDPGKHTIRFANSGHEQVVTIVIGSGEKGRTVVAHFGAPSTVPRLTAAPTFGPPKSQPAQPAQVSHKGATALIIGGAVLAVGGGVLGVVGLVKIPSNCSISSHQCSAAPGDPSFADAAHAARLTDIGWGVGIAGVAAVASGVVLLYVAGPKVAKEHMALAPWLAPGGGGFALSGSL